MTAYRPRPSIVPEGMYAGDYLEDVLMPHWVAAGTSSTGKRFLSALWSFHSSGSTYAPLSRIAKRMGAAKQLAVQGQSEVVELGLVVVTKEVDRKVERTVRSIVAPVDNPPPSVDNPVDNEPERGTRDIPNTCTGTRHIPLGERDTFPRGTRDVPPSKEQEHIKELSAAVDERWAQVCLVMDQLRPRREYAQLAIEVQGRIAQHVRLLVEADPVGCALSDPKVLADKVMADVVG